MVHRARRSLRPLADSFVAPAPSGVAVRTRLKHLTAQDEKVLGVVGEHLGSLAAGDLAARCRDGADHDKERWVYHSPDGKTEGAPLYGMTKQEDGRWLLHACQNTEVRVH